MALVSRIECCKELVASLCKRNYYHGFSVEEDCLLSGDDEGLLMVRSRVG